MKLEIREDQTWHIQYEVNLEDNFAFFIQKVVYKNLKFHKRR